MTFNSGNAMVLDFFSQFNMWISYHLPSLVSKLGKIEPISTFSKTEDHESFESVFLEFLFHDHRHRQAELRILLMYKLSCEPLRQEILCLPISTTLPRRWLSIYANLESNGFHSLMIQRTITERSALKLSNLKSR